MISRSCFVDPVTFCSWEGGMNFFGLVIDVAEMLLSILRRMLQFRLQALYYRASPFA